jgi:hypothetical protein
LHAQAPTGQDFEAQMAKVLTTGNSKPDMGKPFQVIAGKDFTLLRLSLLF